MYLRRENYRNIDYRPYMGIMKHTCIVNSHICGAITKVPSQCLLQRRRNLRFCCHGLFQSGPAAAPLRAETWSSRRLIRDSKLVHLVKAKWDPSLKLLSLNKLEISWRDDSLQLEGQFQPDKYSNVRVLQVDYKNTTYLYSPLVRFNGISIHVPARFWHLWFPVSPLTGVIPHLEKVPPSKS